MYRGIVNCSARRIPTVEYGKQRLSWHQSRSLHVCLLQGRFLDFWNGGAYVFVAVFLGWTSTGRVIFWFLWFYVQELPKAQLAVVLVLKRLRRRVHGLKSHPTDWEKPGIEPAFSLNIPWKWNNSVSQRPNYFIFIGYLKTGNGVWIRNCIDQCLPVELYKLFSSFGDGMSFFKLASFIICVFCVLCFSCSRACSLLPL